MVESNSDLPRLAKTSDIWVVRDGHEHRPKTADEDTQMEVPLDECNFCSRGFHHLDFDDAIQHVANYHYPQAAKKNEDGFRDSLKHWVVTLEIRLQEDKLSAMHGLLLVLRTRVKSLLSRAADIRNGVANEANQRSSQYLLPLALVRAAEHIFRFVFTAVYAFRHLQDDFKHAHRISDDLMKDNEALADYYGILADNALAKSYSQLLLMAHTGSLDDASLVRYVSCTQDTTLMYILRSLVETDTVKQYSEHISNLVSPPLSPDTQNQPLTPKRATKPAASQRKKPSENSTSYKRK